MDDEFHTQSAWSDSPIEREPSSYLGTNVFVTGLDDHNGHMQMAGGNQTLVEHVHVVVRLPPLSDPVARQPQDHRRTRPKHDRPPTKKKSSTPTPPASTSTTDPSPPRADPLPRGYWWRRSSKSSGRSMGGVGEFGDVPAGQEGFEARGGRRPRRRHRPSSPRRALHRRGLR